MSKLTALPTDALLATLLKDCDHLCNLSCVSKSNHMNSFGFLSELRGMHASSWAFPSAGKSGMSTFFFRLEIIFWVQILSFLLLTRGVSIHNVAGDLSDVYWYASFVTRLSIVHFEHTILEQLEILCLPSLMNESSILNRKKPNKDEHFWLWYECGQNFTCETDLERLRLLLPFYF